MKKLLQDWLGLSTMHQEHLAALEALKAHMSAETRVTTVQMATLLDALNLDPSVPDKIDPEEFFSEGGDPQLGSM